MVGLVGCNRLRVQDEGSSRTRLFLEHAEAACVCGVSLKEAGAGQVQEGGLEVVCAVERNWAQRHRASWLQHAAAADGPGQWVLGEWVELGVGG